MLGAYRPGENPQFDRVLPLSEAVNALLRQGPEESRSLSETLKQVFALGERFETVEASARQDVLRAAQREEGEV